MGDKPRRIGKFRVRLQPRQKSTDSVLYQARKVICRVTKIVKIYLVRKYLRSEDDDKKKFAEGLKGISGEAIASAVMPVVEGVIPWPSLKVDDAFLSAVLRHKKIRETVDEWRTRLLDASKNNTNKDIEQKVTKQTASKLEAKPPKLHFSNASQKKAIFVDSLAGEDSGAGRASREQRAWEEKKRKVLRSLGTGQVNDSGRAEAARSAYTEPRSEGKRQSRQVPGEEAESLHPSWIAKKQAKNKIAYTMAIPEGKKTIFADEE